MERELLERVRRWVAEPAGCVLWNAAATAAHHQSRERERPVEPAHDQSRERERPVEPGEIDIIAFRQLPNRRNIRVREEDLAGLAASFTGAPLLRDHDEGHVDSRDGTVIASYVHTGADGVAEIRQRLRITTARGRESLAQGQIDRFSVAFDVAGWTCSVCGGDWLACEHWPGRDYVSGGRRGDSAGRITCELIAEGPVGREVSAVNVPAVAGTGLVRHGAAHDTLADLCAYKRELQARELLTDANARSRRRNVGRGCNPPSPPGWCLGAK
jgi:hypothetical protein